MTDLMIRKESLAVRSKQQAGRSLTVRNVLQIERVTCRLRIWKILSMVYPCWGLFSVQCHRLNKGEFNKTNMTQYVYCVVPWLRRLVARVQSRPVYMEFVVDKAAVGHVAIGVLRFLPPVLFHKHFIRVNSSTTDHAHDI